MSKGLLHAGPLTFLNILICAVAFKEKFSKLYFLNFDFRKQKTLRKLPFKNLYGENTCGKSQPTHQPASIIITHGQSCFSPRAHTLLLSRPLPYSIHSREMLLECILSPLSEGETTSSVGLQQREKLLLILPRFYKQRWWVTQYKPFSVFMVNRIKALSHRICSNEITSRS